MLNYAVEFIAEKALTSLNVFVYGCISGLIYFSYAVLKDIKNAKQK